MKKELQNKMLNEEQAQTVKDMIIDSMRSVYIDDGILPGNQFMNAATNIADAIVKKVQMSLIQTTVYTKAVKNSKPSKVKKTIKKVTTKKHARK